MVQTKQVVLTRFARGKLRNILRSAMDKMSLVDKAVWRKGVAHLKRRDPVLGRVIRAVGPIDFKTEDEHYESLVGAIVFQQLAGSAAQAILNRFMKLYDGRVPKPEKYLATDERKL